MLTALAIIVVVFITVRWCKKMIAKENYEYRQRLMESNDPGDKAVLRAFEAMDEDRRKRQST